MEDSVTTSYHHSQEQAQSPVLPLVEYLNGVRLTEGTIFFPQPLLHASTEFHHTTPQRQVPASDITTLVQALDDGTPDICCRLDGVAFETVYAFLRKSEPCQAYQRGHCLFVESLHSSRATTRAQKASLVHRKASLGKHVLFRSISAFLDRGRLNRARRWVGSLALELLRDCSENRDLLSAQDQFPLREALGECVIHGNDESLRLLAGTIIREMVEHGLSAHEFWRRDAYPDPPFIFEAVVEHASQWMIDFIGFVDNLETQGILTQERSSSTFAFAVYVEGRVYNTKTGLSILVTMTDDLTVVIPSTETDTAKYIDIPPAYISAVQVEEVEPDSQLGPVLPSEAAVLKIQFEAAASAEYYINEVSQRPCQIYLAFDKRDDALLIKREIGVINAPRHNAYRNPTGAVEAKSRTSFTGQSFKGFSQSAFLDVSRHPAQTLGVSTGNIEETRDLRLQQGTATNSQAYNFLAVSNIRGSGPVAGSDSRHPGGDQAFKTNFAGGILVGTDVIDVGQEALQDDVLIHGRSISEDTELMRPTSSSAWHGGLEAIENAKELGPIDQAPPSNIKAHMPNTGENLSIVDDADDDLYYATPPRQNHQPRREASNNSAQNPEACQPHPAASVALIKPKSKKLSQSMRVVGNEESLALPPTTDQGVRPNQKGRNQEVEMLSPHITKPAHLKRKSTTTGAAGPRKKPKVNIVSVEKTVSGRNNAGSIPSRGNEYDLPVTPPGSKRARQKPRASANSMPKVVKSKPRVATPAKTSKQAAAKSFIMRDSDTRKGLRGVKSVEQKQASTAAKTEWDPDPLMDTNKDKSTEGDKGATKPDQKQSRKTKTKATGGGQKAKRSQPTQISTASKAIRISQDAPNRSPRKPRAAKKIAKERISALKDEAIQAVEISSQQETSCRAAISIQESKITAHETPERSVDSANEVMKATQTLSSRKKRRRSSSEACTGNGAKRKPVGDQETNSEQSGPELEDLLLATEPATGESMNQESEPLAGSRSSIEYSTTSATRPSKQRRAPSNIDSLSAAIPLGEKAEGAQYILNNQEAPNFVVDDSKIKPEALKSGTNSLNPRTVDDQDVQSTTHDTDSDDPPFPIMLDIANERADEKATTTMHGGSAKHSTEGTKETTPSKRENSAAALSTKITIPSKENPLDEQVVVSDTIRGKLEESNSSYGLPKTSSQGKKNLPPQSRTTHTLQQSVSAIDGDELQCLHKRSPRNPLNERDYENKILSKRTNPAQVAPGSKNQALSSTLIPAASKLLHKPSPSFSPAHQPKIHPEHQGHDGIRKEETTNRAMTACMINKSDNERRHDIQQQHAEANTEAGIPEILEPQRSEYASIASLALEMDLNDEEPMGPSPPVQHINTPGSGAASVAVRIDPTINPPQHQLPLQASATPDNRSPAWSRLPDAVNEHWDKKRRLLSQAHQASRPNIPSTATHKDPNRRPQLINFSKQGPRNQGVSSPAVSFKSPFIAKDQDPQMEETTFIPAPARRRDIATMTDDALDKKPVHAPIELPDDMDDMEFVQEATLVSDSAPPGFRQARQRTKGPCLEHSIVFASDHAPKVSSQSSRVTENGSPMPVQRTLPRVSIVKEPCRTNIAQVGSKNINVLSHRDKTVSVHQHDDESSEIELPQLTAPRSHPRKQPAFLGSSNSKHHPSSPNAPSAIVTDVQPHTVEPNGRLVNLRTEKILVPSQPPNPFANQKIQHTNRFLDKLRRASDEARDKLTGGSQDLKASQQPRGDRPADDKEDPDRTLVEYPTGYSGRKKQATPTGTSTSSLDTSSEESGASEASDASNVMLERWRQSLEPHQENMWAILHEISHGLFSHLMDSETAIEDVVKDYQSRGERVIKTLADDLERELEEYTTSADARREETAKKLEGVHARIRKGLRRKEKVEGLVVRMEERWKVVDEQMEAALRLCGGGGGE